MNSLAKLLEAALFASPRPIPTDELAALDDDASRAAVAAALEELREHYNVDGHGVELVEQGGGWQILTRPEYTEAIERAQMAVRPSRLSGAALETLAIIAYRQPIGRAEIAEIRGVDVGAILLLTGIRMWRSKGHAVDPERNLVLRLFRRFVPVTDQYEGASFVVRRARAQARRFVAPLNTASNGRPQPGLRGPT